MGKTFAEYQAEHAVEPFPLPMPDGTSIMLPRASINDQQAVRAAISARTSKAQNSTPFTGLEVLVGDKEAERIAEAWGTLPADAWDAVLADMKEHFGQGNSGASPPS